MKKMEEEHKAEMERYKKENPDAWAKIAEESKTLNIGDIIKKAVG